jgi:hypothetical protein
MRPLYHVVYQPFTSCASLNIGYPLRVVQVPLPCLANPGLEGLGRFQTQFGFKIAQVYRPAKVDHVRDQQGIVRLIYFGAKFDQQFAHGLVSLASGLHIPAAHVNQSTIKNFALQKILLG